MDDGVRSLSRLNWLTLGGTIGSGPVLIPMMLRSLANPRSIVGGCNGEVGRAAMSASATGDAGALSSSLVSISRIGDNEVSNMIELPDVQFRKVAKSVPNADARKISLRCTFDNEMNV